MATKRASSEKKPTRRKATTTAPVADTAEFSVLSAEPIEGTEATRVDPERRRQLVAAEAYFRAERRGFTAGHELDDWVAAEAAVDSRGMQQQVA